MSSQKKYLIIGCGGVGGTLAAKLAQQGKDLSVIARGEHLRKIQENGLSFSNETETVKLVVKASSFEGYQESPDVIFIATKAYALEACLGFIQRVAHKHSLIIPLVNTFGSGRILKEQLHPLPVLDAVIYMVGQIVEPGVIKQSGNLLKLIVGSQDQTELYDEIEELTTELKRCGIYTIHSTQPLKDCFIKYSFISPLAALCIYHNTTVGAAQVPGALRDFFIQLVRELIAVGQAMGLELETEEVLAGCLRTLDAMNADSSASTYRDVKEGKRSEVDGIIYEVSRLGKRYQTPTPLYDKINEELRSLGI